MDRQKILGRLSKIFEDVMDVDNAVLTDDSTADDFAEWVSLSHVRFLISIERQLNVKFTNSEIDSLKRVGDIVDLLLSKGVVVA